MAEPDNAKIPNLSTERIEFLKDIFVGIFEDYSTNTWRHVRAYKWVDRESKRIYGIIIETGDGDVEEEHMVNLATVRLGVQRLINREVAMNESMRRNIHLASKSNDASSIDAYDADAILQAGIFNELRYG